MTSTEYFITAIFLLIFFLGMALVAILTVRGAERVSQEKTKTGILCFVCAILVVIAGVVGWYNISNNPDWAFLKTPICPECNHIVSYDDKYCDECGTEIKPELLCETCDAVYDTHDKYCAQCGTQLQKGASNAEDNDKN